MGELATRAKVIPHCRIYASRALPPVNLIQTAPQAPIYDLDLGLFGGELPVMAAVSKQRQPVKRPKLDDRYESQGVLPLDFPPTVIELAASLGPTHQAIAEKLGISRPQVSNIINGQFGSGRWVARRVIELARAA
jgi:hypothetical protein